MSRIAVYREGVNPRPEVENYPGFLDFSVSERGVLRIAGESGKARAFYAPGRWIKVERVD